MYRFIIVIFPCLLINGIGSESAHKAHGDYFWLTLKRGLNVGSYFLSPRVMQAYAKVHDIFLCFEPKIG